MNTFKQRKIGNTTCTVSELGLGCASLAGVGTSVPDDQARGTLAAALEAGIRYFDTAPFYGYGRSERLVGDALRCQPDTVCLSTKAGRLLRPCCDPLPEDDLFPDSLPMRPHYDYSYDGIMRSFEDSLQRLGLSKIDILLLHDVDAVTHGAKAHPAVFREAMAGGYRALSELRSKGLVKAIGLGVNEWDTCVNTKEQCLLCADEQGHQRLTDNFLRRLVVLAIDRLTG
ncbi:MAG: aldo/keto reductase [Gammaproteobacteria bacterium]|nr:aldo/keto reductase [Gammaproteobacteria bacterium]